MCLHCICSMPQNLINQPEFFYVATAVLHEYLAAEICCKVYRTEHQIFFDLQNNWSQCTLQPVTDWESNMSSNNSGMPGILMALEKQALYPLVGMSAERWHKLLLPLILVLASLQGATYESLQQSCRHKSRESLYSAVMDATAIGNEMFNLTALFIAACPSFVFCVNDWWNSTSVFIHEYSYLRSFVFE